jgi:serine/threonine-protein kinase RsbW
VGGVKNSNDKPTPAPGSPLPAWRQDVHLPSERGSSRRVTDELLEQLGAHGWSPSDLFSIHLAAEEAIVNAIVHGNKLDPAKTVHVVCHVDAELVRVEITDEGDGFDPAQVPDCTLEDRLEVPSGRGVMLMRNFMSRIEYNAKGNSVLMEKRREPEPQS